MMMRNEDSNENFLKSYLFKLLTDGENEDLVATPSKLIHSILKKLNDLVVSDDDQTNLN